MKSGAFHYLASLFDDALTVRLLKRIAGEAGVETTSLGDTVRFYEDVLGLVNGPRPPFDFPGAWLYSEGHPVLHLNDISPTDKQQRPDSGVIDHVAFGSRGFEGMKKHLAQKGVEFRVNEVPNSTRRQIFLTDPNNVLIELNFDVAAERS